MQNRFEDLRMGMLDPELHCKVLKIIDGISTRGNPYLHIIAMDADGKKSRINAWGDNVLQFKLTLEEKSCYSFKKFEVCKVQDSYKLDSINGVILNENSVVEKLNNALNINIAVIPQAPLSAIRHQQMNKTVSTTGIITMLSAMRVS